MMATDSWQLKLRRAEKHLKDLKRLVARYRKGNFYRAVGSVPPQGDPTKWRFSLDITQQPDEGVVLVLGDFLYNLHSALDHIAVAVAPPENKYHARFPLEDVDIFARNPITRKMDPRLQIQRVAFGRALRGMHPDARAFITLQQPYNLAARVSPRVPNPGGAEALATLRVLRNADAHRRLTVISAALLHPMVHISLPDVRFEDLMLWHYLQHGAEVTSWKEILPRRVRQDEVDVQIVATPQITVKVRDKGDYLLSHVTQAALTRVRDFVIPGLEPYARKRP